jgi:hypothetical protein
MRQISVAFSPLLQNEVNRHYQEFLYFLVTLGSYSKSLATKKICCLACEYQFEVKRRYGIQHNDIQHNDIKHDDTQHGLMCDTQHKLYSA